MSYNVFFLQTDHHKYFVDMYVILLMFFSSDLNSIGDQDDQYARIKDNILFDSYTFTYASPLLNF